MKKLNILLIVVVSLVFLISCKNNDERKREASNEDFKDVKRSDVRDIYLSYVRFIYSEDKMKEFNIPLDEKTKGEIFKHLKSAEEIPSERSPKCLTIDGVEFLLNVAFFNKQEVRYTMHTCFVFRNTSRDTDKVLYSEPIYEIFLKLYEKQRLPDGFTLED